QKMTEKVDTINTAIGRAFQIAENAAARDHASALNSEQTIEQVLTRFRHATDSLAESASLLQNESTEIHLEISNVIVSLQFQDRVSQILSHVRQNMESLSNHLVTSEQNSQAGGPIQIDANRWLAEMELSYATDEQRNIHHGRTTRSVKAQPSSADITFF
ncbi:MAG: methyl-accepting chemotaxis protein, partial [Aeromonas sobria]